MGVTLDDDESLRAELSSILQISETNKVQITTAETSEKTASDHSDTRQPYSIEEQILQLRRQLREDYNLFVGARESLAAISFAGLDKKFGAQSSSQLPNDQLSWFNDSHKASNNPIRMAQSMFAASKSATKIPELNTFFLVVAQLRNGIRSMEANQMKMTELNERVADAVHADSQYVVDVQKRLASSTVSDETICKAEQQWADLEAD